MHLYSDLFMKINAIIQSGTYVNIWNTKGDALDNVRQIFWSLPCCVVGCFFNLFHPFKQQTSYVYIYPSVASLVPSVKSFTSL